MTGPPPGPPAPGGRLDRPLAVIAGEIIDDLRWHGEPVPTGAEPYLHAMLGVATTDLGARHGHGHVADLVRGALDNLHGWHTQAAVGIKQELREALDAHRPPRPAG